MDLDSSTTPARCSALEPRIATPIASSHMRMRLRLPMFTQSDTAPMVQNSVLFATAPNTNASANAPSATYGASCAGLSLTELLLPCLFLHLAQLLHPLRPVVRAGLVALLQIREDAGPGAVEIGVGLVPLI